MARMRSDHPNVVVFFTDQQRWDTTRVHGYPLFLTPNFECMARYGTHISHSFTNQPVCGPARSSLQTGLYPTTTGCYRNGIPLPTGAKTLTHYFSEAGYDTGYIGKWHLADEEPVPESKRGGLRALARIQHFRVYFGGLQHYRLRQPEPAGEAPRLPCGCFGGCGNTLHRCAS